MNWAICYSWKNSIFITATDLWGDFYHKSLRRIQKYRSAWLDKTAFTLYQRSHDAETTLICVSTRSVYICVLCLYNTHLWIRSGIFHMNIRAWCLCKWRLGNNGQHGTVESQSFCHWNCHCPDHEVELLLKRPDPNLVTEKINRQPYNTDVWIRVWKDRFLPLYNYNSVFFLEDDTHRKY